MQDGSKKAIIAAFMANLGIAIAKFIGFLITASAGLLAEAVHSLADTANQGLLLLGSKRAERDRGDRLFGHGNERYFWAFIVALVMFSMGGLFALYEGIQKLREPHEADNLPVAIVILVAAILMEGYSLRTAAIEARRHKPPAMSWFRFIRATRSPELPTVLLEDFAAEIGLVLALTGVIVAHVTGEPRWDAAGSIAIGVLLVAVAFILAREMKSLLLGEAATAETAQAITEAMTRSPHVVTVIDVRTFHAGPEELLVAAKVEFDRSLNFEQLAHAIDDLEAQTRAAVPIAKAMYIEPDVFRTRPR
ncbi:MAG: cation diffusion facilitator family transporter [Ilumatobacteraceae bacterium]